jgi:hypothetical protein
MMMMEMDAEEPKKNTGNGAWSTPSDDITFNEKKKEFLLHN